MKMIAVVVVLAIIAGTGTAIALNVKSQRTSAEKWCVGLSCWPDSPAGRHKPAQRTTVTSPSQSELIEQPDLPSQASGIDRSRKADRITIVVPATDAVLPPGCEPPFSPLAKLPPPSFKARCLT
jgi:hypothetical protein